MDEALLFFRSYEVWIYLLLGLIGLYYIRKFILAWQELKAATFGLERESAQGRLNAAASMLVLILALALVEFTLVSFIIPTRPQVMAIATPTLDLLATPTNTLMTTEVIVEVTPGENSELPTATPPLSEESGCIPEEVYIDAPSEGTSINGIIEIRGTVQADNFGFYKLEMKRSDEQSWLTILAGNQTKQNEVLGAWNTSLLAAGEYQLALVVVDNQGQSLPACIVKIFITNPTQDTQP